MGLSGPARVVIVDDHSSFRDAARHCLTARGYDVVAEASCAATAMRALERYYPDVMLLDLHLGDDDGFAVCDAVTRIRPHLAVVLTSAENYEQFSEADRVLRRAGIHPEGASSPRRFGPVLAVCLSPQRAGETSSRLLPRPMRA